MDTSAKDVELIWMIDDDKIHHFWFQKSLQIQGFSKQVMSFFKAEEAIEFFDQHLNDFSVLPDIIFLDLNMPLVNGWQFLQRYATIKEKLQKPIKIYVLSSTINKEEINRATSIPEVSGFFSKPLKPDDINQIWETN